MKFCALLLFCLHAAALAGRAGDYQDFDQPPHDYWKRAPQDRFSRWMNDVKAGRVQLDYSGEKAFIASVLKSLDIPASSQMLSFSTTSLQLSLISPRTPRALYFNEDVYVGYVVGGKVEVVAVDPELGGIFYIFDIPRNGQPPRPERATRCMNCHAREDTGYVPGLVVKSVIPGPTGGSLESFRQALSGHGVPLNQRFGGWYLTGAGGLTNHLANFYGRSTPQGIVRNPIPPGTMFSYDRYLVAHSDLLPQLLHEHQIGFVNRAIEATYRTRTYLDAGQGKLSPEHAKILDEQAKGLTRYLLFADEVPLPVGGVAGDEEFKTDFLSQRHIGPGGAALKDFELRTRLFQNRCSYMIYSAAFRGLPAEMKQRVFARLAQALDSGKPNPEFAYLPAAEKQKLRGILRETVVGLPSGW
ncbi:MAG: hypothetical protein B9S33_00630 [Pedosphaera sp. Tous-C6FEB]|nr:MAG: hypothetical protein B9S33_00630 [Pedosphaera sp. Tous-C6FEB]